MAIQADFYLTQGNDVTLNINLIPQTPISGWTIEFQSMLRFGGVNNIYTGFLASGFIQNQSGMTLVNGGVGSFQVYIPGAVTGGTASGISISGVAQPLPYDAYAYQLTRIDSGFVSTLAEGYLINTP